MRISRRNAGGEDRKFSTYRRILQTFHSKKSIVISIINSAGMGPLLPAKFHLDRSNESSDKPKNRPVSKNNRPTGRTALRADPAGKYQNMIGSTFVS